MDSYVNQYYKHNNLPGMRLSCSSYTVPTSMFHVLSRSS